LFPFSLTKYSAIFTEVKGYFGIIEIVFDACAPAEYGIEIESTINPCPQGSSNKSVGAGCAPSELDSTINLNADAVF
jgi:hypothetical protein